MELTREQSESRRGNRLPFTSQGFSFREVQTDEEACVSFRCGLLRISASDRDEPRARVTFSTISWRAIRLTGSWRTGGANDGTIGTGDPDYLPGQFGDGIDLPGSQHVILPEDDGDFRFQRPPVAN